MDRPSPRHLEDAYSPTASQETTSNELAQRLDHLQIAAAVADENACLENRWCQLRDTDQSTALAAPSPPLTTVTTEMQDAWTVRKAEEIQGYADRNEWKDFLSAIKAACDPPPKGIVLLLGADGSTLQTEKTQILQR
nr:unnamed protein product [Spirometra erinaceieuropaei]